MIARLLALLALALALPAAAPVDWTRTAVRTAQGGIRVGNPAARVGLVEIANYTCPHCAHFSAAASATLAQKIRGGALAVEFRPIVNNNLGLAATMLARCAAPGAFLAVNDALYARQDAWFAQAARYAQASAGELATYSELDQLQQIAEHGGIATVAVAAGMPAPRVTQCFADRRALDDALRAVANAGAIAQSTPTFLIGRARVEGADWPAVSAQLRAAGLR